jgi:hypothetical protein
MNRIMIAVFFILAGCGNKEMPHRVIDIVDVNVPILERATAPKELFRTKLPATSLPRWVAPTDPTATACIGQPGEVMLKSLMLNRESLLDGWESYAR